ncbi:hypothetical protein F5146DRAFT_1145652 [Armillaria mellea]|nr:hypothetical protein F5146DRAFT_1145652 [Armillaria mellea]
MFTRSGGSKSTSYSAATSLIPNILVLEYHPGDPITFFLLNSFSSYLFLDTVIFRLYLYFI